MAGIHEYRIRALIGEGTLGTVYAAEHSHGRGKAALKILHDHFLEDRARVESFRRDAAVARSIGHPHIAEIIEEGALPAGQPYVITELLRGETLGDRLRRMPCLPLADALDFAGQAAAALGAVHQHGLVHGGLTREDLFLIPDLGMRRGERVKLLDLGMAPLRRRPDPVHGLPVGATLYLAPERWRNGNTLDASADIYALAGVLYHALGGVPPHLAATLDELMVMHREERPASLRALNEDVPTHVEAAILRALAKRPEDRFTSMAGFARALRVGRATGARRGSALRPAAAGLAAAICGFFLFSARAPGGSSLPRVSRSVLGSAAVSSPVSGGLVERLLRGKRPTIVPLPADHGRPRAISLLLRKRPTPPRESGSLTALLEREDLWGHRH